MKTVGQDVQEKAADEFTGIEGHELAARVTIGAIVFVLEADALAVEGDEPGIGDGDAVGVATEIGEHLRRAGEGALRKHDPADRPQVPEEAGERAAIGQGRGAAGEGEIARIVRPQEAGEILRAKDDRHRPDR
jgi:hypothetical protein